MSLYIVQVSENIQKVKKTIVKKDCRKMLIHKISLKKENTVYQILKVKFFYYMYNLDKLFSEKLKTLHF